MERFIIAGTQRTGTSLVNNLLRSHPETCMLGEVFIFKGGRGQRIEGSYRQFINQRRLARGMSHYLSRQSLIDEYLDQTYHLSDSRAVGFKLMLNQARDFPQAIRYIRKNRINVLHVLRENVLKTLVSRVSAKSRKLYHVSDTISVQKIHLPTRGLKKRLGQIKEEIVVWKELSARNPYLALPYESLLANRELEFNRALEFLGLRTDVSTSTKLKKINPDSLEDVVENISEITHILTGTEYEKYLE